MAVNLRALNRRGFASSLDPAFCLAAVQVSVQRPFLLPTGFNALRVYAVQRASALGIRRFFDQPLVFHVLDLAHLVTVTRLGKHLKILQDMDGLDVVRQ